jgi:hypothetical protein
MESPRANHQGQENKHDDLRVEDVSSFMNYLAGLLETLAAKINVLPMIDEEGNSECPFAEDLYEAKEDAEQKVTEELDKASHYISLLGQEIARLRGNHARISADAGSLNSAEAKERYLYAKRGLEQHIEKNLKQRDELMDLISKAERLLGLARSKKFPVKVHRKKSHVPPARGAGTIGSKATDMQEKSPPAPPSPRPPTTTEVDSLISLGPIGKKMGRTFFMPGR